MSGKDFLTILLVTYGFKNIEISTYRGCGNTIGYKIYAENEETEEYYQEENCEGIMFNIAHLINKMQEKNIEAIYTPFPGYNYPMSEILKMFK
jgi:hypothetical protein